MGKQKKRCIGAWQLPCPTFLWKLGRESDIIRETEWDCEGDTMDSEEIIENNKTYWKEHADLWYGTTDLQGTFDKEFGFMKENAPRFTAFAITAECLDWQVAFENARNMNCKNMNIGIVEENLKSRCAKMI